MIILAIVIVIACVSSVGMNVVVLRRLGVRPIASLRKARDKGMKRAPSMTKYP